VSSRKKWGGWNAGPKLDEARVIAPEVAPRSRPKKDRRRWCKGKATVEHAWEIKLSKHAIYWGARNSGSEHRRCGWRAEHERVNYADHYEWIPTGEWRWNCVHVHACKNCGKIFEQYVGIGSECPIERPPTPAECSCLSCARPRPPR
jgi:hypothetical protein